MSADQSATVKGTVIAAFGRQYKVAFSDGHEALCFPRAKKSIVACGDEVQVILNSDGQGVIESILPRRTLFYRADAYKQKLIAANVSQLIVVVATEPSFSEELITRCLCAADSQEIKTLIVLNKSDLTAQRAHAQALLSPFIAIGYTVLELCAQKDVQALRMHLAGQTSLFIGQSGMGKSTLTNALVPEANAATREISDALDTGKHTTTHARLYRLAGGGNLIDSPGLQTFGLAHLSKQELEASFPEIRECLGACRFRDCQHLHEPDCAIRAALAKGTMHASRYSALLKFLAEDRKAAAVY